MKQLIIFLITAGFYINGTAQTAEIRIDGKLEDNSFRGFESIRFQFNDTYLSATDTVTKTIRLQKGLDDCTAIIGPDTLRFYTRFLAGNKYVIRPGCCCAAFTLEPEHDPRRGTVTFKNHTKKDFGIVVAGSTFNTLPAGKMQTLFAHESAMCTFKPCSILITETFYMTDESDPTNLSLKAKNKQKQYILSESWFQFLHGEQVEVIYTGKKGSGIPVVTGYLSEEDHKKWGNL